MCFTAYEKSIFQALYDYSRVPLWIYNKNRKLELYFFSETLQGLNDVLSGHMDTVIAHTAQPDFDILSYENELYYIFAFEHADETFYALGGPMLLAGFYPPTAMRSLSFAYNMNSKELESLIVSLPVMTLASFASFLRIMMLFLHRPPKSADEISNYNFSSLKGALKYTLTHELFENRSDFRVHTPYSHEIAILNCVKDGNTAKLESTFKALPETKYGNMSANPLRQLFYGCIAATTLVTRYAIEGGLDEETAFTMSDVYIKKMENCRTLYELNLLNERMAVDFTEQVAKAKSSRQPLYTEPITKCIDYILLNVQEKITLEALAKEVNLTPKYLSRLFSKETGQTLGNFIEDCKISEAKNLLVFSQYAYSEISNYLSFNSHSYFISVFKKKVGMTPKEYRLRFAQSSWEVSRKAEE